MQLLTMQPPAPAVPVRHAVTPVPFFRTIITRSVGFKAPLPPAVRRPAPPVAPPVVKAPGPDACALPCDVASRFGRRIRELRHARGMTQLQVAVHFGIDRTFISDVERGRKGVCLPTMEVFALGFGVSLSDLLRGI